MQRLPSMVLDEIFDAIEAGCTEVRLARAVPKPKRLAKKVDLSKLSDNELAITLFPGCRDWLEKPHRYDHTPEMYISVHFNRTNDLQRQYGMIRYMELRPTEDNKNIVEAWYRDLRAKRTHSFDDKPILPGVPNYPCYV